MKKVLVLLSTYNGEAFIKDQIDSILRQKNVKISVIVRDDGSRDNTISILKQYESNYQNLKIISGNNLGSAHSFFELIKYASIHAEEYNYYSFSDQDDVWKEEKIYSACKQLGKFSPEQPSLYLGAYQMVDEFLNQIKTPQIKPKLSLPAAMAANCATGCTMVFNKTLLKAMPCPDTNDIIMHDYWVYLYCLLIGGNVYYDKIPYIYYRQHNHNVIGGKKDSFFWRWKNRIIKAFMKGNCYKSKLANILLINTNSKTNISCIQFLEAIGTCNKISSKFRIFCTRDFWCESIDKNLQNIGLVITGKF